MNKEMSTLVLSTTDVEAEIKDNVHCYSGLALNIIKSYGAPFWLGLSSRCH